MKPHCYMQEFVFFEKCVKILAPPVHGVYSILLAVTKVNNSELCCSTPWGASCKLLMNLSRHYVLWRLRLADRRPVHPTTPGICVGDWLARRFDVQEQMKV